MRRPPALLGLTALLGLAGCLPFLQPQDQGYPLLSQPEPIRIEKTTETDMRSQVYAATDAMIGNTRSYLDPRRAIVPASFVNQDNIDSTSPLGRLISNMMASRFTQRGYAISQVKLRKSLLIQPGSGEFMLSRDLDEIRQSSGGQAVLTGWYTIAHQNIFVTAQVISLKDGTALASTDFELPSTGNVRALLGLKPGQKLEDLER